MKIGNKKHTELRILSEEERASMQLVQVILRRLLCFATLASTAQQRRRGQHADSAAMHACMSCAFDHKLVYGMLGMQPFLWGLASGYHDVGLY